MENEKLSDLEKVNIIRMINYATKQIKHNLNGFISDIGTISEQQDLMIKKTLEYSKIIAEEYKPYFKYDLQVKEKLPNGEVIFEWKITPKGKLPDITFDFNIDIPIDK